MTAPTLYIYGAGGHSQTVMYTAELLGYHVKGFVVDPQYADQKTWSNLPTLLPNELPSGAYVAIAIGNCERRLDLGRSLLNQGYHCPTIIHPAAQVSPGCRLGTGCFVGALANIDPACIIGDFCIINNQSGICHDSALGNGCHICPGAILAGGVKLGERCWIGLGSRVIENIEIGDGSMIGAGSVVVKNISSAKLAFGVPCREQRTLENTEKNRR